MDKQRKVIITLLVANMVLSIYAIYKIESLRSQDIGDLRYYVKQAHENFENKLNDDIRQVRQENQWISLTDAQSIDDTEENEVIELYFLAKDYTVGSEITFKYGKKGEDSFKSIPLKNIVDGNFSVQLEIDAKKNVLWDIYYTKNNDSYREKVSDDSASYVYEYYIISKSNDRILSTETQQINLSKYIKGYSSMKTDIIFDYNEIPHEVECSFVPYEKIVPMKIILEVYNGNDMVKEKIADEFEKHLVRWDIEEKIFDRIVINVSYEDGNSVSKEVWKKTS